ncbi:MAG TPA: glycoside hydrolase family 2 TIM barrel-domain containing protein, partial [Prolixibacteraceae bacterium]|nr:glycoside hydrolase family 2 TIM barrel-domain containing protein [Prolixibacteraceae bacterium]
TILCINTQFTSLQAQTTPETISLKGKWSFSLDTLKTGVEEGWFSKKLADEIQLPGTTDEQKKGRANNRKETGRLTRVYPYYGPAWYQKEIEVPAKWSGKHIFFTMERTKTSQVWLDDTYLGTQNSLTTTQVYELTSLLTPGKHMLTVCIDNENNPPIGNPHQLSDGTQTNWNGLLGNIELQIKDPVYMTDVQVYPNVPNKKAIVRIDFNTRCKGNLTISANSWNTKFNHKIITVTIPFETGTDNVFETTVSMGDSVQLWDEFSPALYALKVDFTGQFEGKQVHDQNVVNFGMRNFTTNGKQFQVNGKTIFLRGKHDACVFPITGYAPMDKEEMIRIFKIAKSYGINHYRYHTWCPPRASFEAADVVGIYLQPELPLWGSLGKSDQQTNGDVELKIDDSPEGQRIDYLLEEGKRMMKMFGNYASFCMFGLGNELHGDRGAMGKMIEIYRKADPRHLYTQGSNNFLTEPRLSPGDDYWSTTLTGGHYNAGVYYPDTKGLEVRSSFPQHKNGHVNNDHPNTLYDYSTGIKNVPVPVISHENGQYQVYPNFKEIEKYTGVVQARNFEIFRERLEKAGMLDQSDDFFKASGALAVICYREEIETALRTDGFGGIQLLDLQDFPGQGTALVGILDAFMDSKGFITPEKWREFCSEIVPLARMKKRTWTNNETFEAGIQIANFGASAINETLVKWSLTDKLNKQVATGEIKVSIPQGKLFNAGDISVGLSKIKQAQQLLLNIALEGTTACNTYQIWVYPEKVNVNVPKGVTISNKLDEVTINILKGGGNVLLLPDTSTVKNAIEGAFQTDFWCYPMFKKYSPPGTLGILCNPVHPIFNSFPTEFHSNWQWWPLLKNGIALKLDKTQADFRPIVQVIDNFERNLKLGVIFECKVGEGKLLVCSCNLLNQQDKPEARQLLSSLLKYASSKDFNPIKSLGLDVLKDCLQ